MKHLPVTLAAALCAALAAPACAAPLVSSAIVAAPSAPLLHLAAMGDDPATKPRRGGGRHHGKVAAETSAGTPELHSGETAESAQKAYQKKYGF